MVTAGALVIRKYVVCYMHGLEDEATCIDGLSMRYYFA